MAESLMVQPDLKFIQHIRAAGGDTLKKCYQCATCSVVCNLSPEHKPFPRKEMLWASWGLKDRLLSDPDVWLCHQCNDCSTNCPRGARPGDVLAAVRKYIFEDFAFPKFMGRALADPKYLPWLLIVPAIMLLVLIMSIHNWNFDFFRDTEVIYHEFFPHKYLEPLFMAGNVLIFVFAAISLSRFWRGLQGYSGENRGPGFISSAIQSLITIIFHSRFYQCEASKPRAIGHILIFGGFVGAMVTTGFVIIFTIFFPIFHSPLNISNPIKILGILSGLSMMVGWFVLYLRSLKAGDDDRVEKRAYSDSLFLNMVFFTALTGMLTFLLRLVGNPVLAYTTYYVHLVIVFFLLWYAPYYKFAHMFYRTLAMIWAKGVSRGEPRKK